MNDQESFCLKENWDRVYNFDNNFINVAHKQMQASFFFTKNSKTRDLSTYDALLYELRQNDFRVSDGKLSKCKNDKVKNHFVSLKAMIREGMSFACGNLASREQNINSMP